VHWDHYLRDEEELREKEKDEGIEIDFENKTFTCVCIHAFYRYMRRGEQRDDYNLLKGCSLDVCNEEEG
jgi:hypothetical protein